MADGCFPRAIVDHCARFCTGYIPLDHSVSPTRNRKVQSGEQRRQTYDFPRVKRLWRRILHASFSRWSLSFEIPDEKLNGKNGVHEEDLILMMSVCSCQDLHVKDDAHEEGSFAMLRVCSCHVRNVKDDAHEEDSLVMLRVSENLDLHEHACCGSPSSTSSIVKIPLHDEERAKRPSLSTIPFQEFPWRILYLIFGNQAHSALVRRRPARGDNQLILRSDLRKFGVTRGPAKLRLIAFQIDRFSPGSVERNLPDVFVEASKHLSCEWQKTYASENLLPWHAQRISSQALTLFRTLGLSVFSANLLRFGASPQPPFAWRERIWP